MVICRVPLRVSFFGGGTDYPSWYLEHGGQVLSTTIDKYCYISCRYLPPFFDHKFRIVYSQLEYVKALEDIEHPSVRECLRYVGMEKGMEIHYDSDLPARTGLGSSSSFTVGMLHALYTLIDKEINKQKLASDAIFVEREKIGEVVGSQDQTSVAYGGFNTIHFPVDSDILVDPISLPSDRLNDLNDHLLLFYTGISRFAHEVAKDQVERTKNNRSQLKEMYDMVDEGKSILDSSRSLNEFGYLLDVGWQLKRSLSTKISNPFLDDVYARAKSSGALGGKLLGAGAGGFFLIFAEPDSHESIKKSLSDLLEIPFSFDSEGSKVVFKDVSS